MCVAKGQNLCKKAVDKSEAEQAKVQTKVTAAGGKASVPDLLGWLADPADRTPIDLLRDMGMAALAA